MIEAGLAALLLNDARFSALCADRLYPVSLPDDSAIPSVTYQVASSKNSYIFSGPDVATISVQFDAWGQTYLDAVTVANAIGQVLSSFRGMLPDGTNILAITRGTMLDSFESDSVRYGRRTTYSVQTFA